jgi:hypothetical protein
MGTFEACDRHEIRLECECCVEGRQLKECGEARSVLAIVKQGSWKRE